jgi:hypothetical protein
VILDGYINDTLEDGGMDRIGVNIGGADRECDKEVELQSNDIGAERES